ncbi:MAG: DUF362 domain-containing protein [Candidatus Bathyarchaeota archaeon]|nr:MAG: DUF362 domain-containing protein [Candidatus Bathyarchaeota archaeon]
MRERLVKSKSNLLFAFSMFWFAVRVIPKPSRIMYPCQRTTLTLIFVRVGIGISAVCITLTEFAQKRVVKALIILLLVAEIAFPVIVVGYYSVRYSIISQGRIVYNVDLSHEVVRVHSADVTSWDFNTGYYWEYVDQSVVDLMVEEGVKELTSQSTSEFAWRFILSNYSQGDIVGIKINGNDFWNTRLGEINTLPHVINSVVKGLKSIGVSESDIWVIEPTAGSNRQFYQYYYDIINGLYPEVQLLDNDDTTFGSYSELRVSFPYTNDRYITDQMYEIDHLILIPVMKAIWPNCGVTGAIKMMQGNIQNQAGLHNYLTRTSADNPNVLIYQNPHIIGKVRLIIGDGLFGAWTGIHFGGGYGGTDVLVSPNHRDDVPNRWLTFGNGAPNVLFFGVDPVAIDSVMYDHLIRERNAQEQVPGQSMAVFHEPQLIAGAAAGIGVRDHGPPYTGINYIEVDL